MPFITYAPQPANRHDFVDFWSDRYLYADEGMYDHNIGLELSQERIEELFRWKNGRPLSEKKAISVRDNFINRRHELAMMDPNLDPRTFLATFNNGGAIWRIFWLHCWNPARFPIYDQHVHRAMEYIQTGQPHEIPGYDPAKIACYVERYLPFHAEFDGINGRSVDKALWAFGKFLNENNFPTI